MEEREWDRENGIEERGRERGRGRCMNGVSVCVNTRICRTQKIPQIVNFLNF